jgi:hypothetical protein
MTNRMERAKTPHEYLAAVFHEVNIIFADPYPLQPDIADYAEVLKPYIHRVRLMAKIELASMENLRILHDLQDELRVVDRYIAEHPLEELERKMHQIKNERHNKIKWGGSD